MAIAAPAMAAAVQWRHFDLQSAAAPSPPLFPPLPPPSAPPHLAQICSWRIKSQGAVIHRRRRSSASSAVDYGMSEFVSKMLARPLFPPTHECDAGAEI